MNLALDSIALSAPRAGDTAVDSPDGERRPDPDELLAAFEAEEREKKRGKLTIFFGAAPGVGKTYAMLEAARFEREEGRDVVVGIVETHGRYDTGALLARARARCRAGSRPPRRRRSRSSTSTPRSRASPA